jgi:hypothetical protein
MNFKTQLFLATLMLAAAGCPPVTTTDTDTKTEVPTTDNDTDTTDTSVTGETGG